MTSNVLDERSLALHLDFSIADAVRHRGLVRVIGAAIGAWLAQRPKNRCDVPPCLREDVGLPPADEPLLWYSVPVMTAVPILDKRRRH